MGNRRSSFRLAAGIAASLVLLAAIAASLHLIPPRIAGAKSRRHKPSAALTPPAATGSAAGPGLNCAGTPGSGQPDYASMDACGYPSPNTTGVPAGTPLAPSGGFTVSTDGTVVNALDVSGTIEVAANNVTIKNSEVRTSGDFGIDIEAGVTGTVIKNVTINGLDTTSAGELQWGIYNQGAFDAVSADHVDFYNGERILVGPGTLTNSFCLDNVNNPRAHYECIYEGQGSVTLDHNTLLTAHNQTAAIYLSTDFGPLGTVKVTNNLLAGGSYTLYGGATSTEGVSSETVTGNRFARLYYPDGGYYGPVAYMPSKYTWSGNIWDDTGRRVSS